MSKEPSRNESERVDLAFNLVLAAEAQARERVEACRRDAAAAIELGALRARGIADLADRRMRLAHRVADRGVDRAVAQLLVRYPSAETEAQSEAQDGRLDRAIVALADEILGPSPGAGS